MDKGLADIYCGFSCPPAAGNAAIVCNYPV